MVVWGRETTQENIGFAHSEQIGTFLYKFRLGGCTNRGFLNRFIGKSVLLTQSFDAVRFLLCKAGRKEGRNSPLCFKPEKVPHKNPLSLIAFTKRTLSSFHRGVKLSPQAGLCQQLILGALLPLFHAQLDGRWQHGLAILAPADVYLLLRTNLG